MGTAALFLTLAADQRAGSLGVRRTYLKQTKITAVSCSLIPVIAFFTRIDDSIAAVPSRRTTTAKSFTRFSAASSIDR